MKGSPLLNFYSYRIAILPYPHLFHLSYLFPFFFPKKGKLFCLFFDFLEVYATSVVLKEEVNMKIMEADEHVRRELV